LKSSIRDLVTGVMKAIWRAETFKVHYNRPILKTFKINRLRMHWIWIQNVNTDSPLSILFKSNSVVKLLQHFTEWNKMPQAVIKLSSTMSSSLENNNKDSTRTDWISTGKTWAYTAKQLHSPSTSRPQLLDQTLIQFTPRCHANYAIKNCFGVNNYKTER